MKKEINERLKKKIIGEINEDKRGDNGRFEVSEGEGESTPSTPPVVANDVEVPRH